MTPATLEDRVTGPVESAASIFERACCLALELHRFGTTRKLAIADLKPEVETNAEFVRASKKLLQSEALDTIARADKALRSYLASKTSGPALFRASVYLLGYDITKEVDTEVQARLTERKDVLVPAFMATWDQVVEDARRQLGAHFRAEQYPTRDTVEASFTASVRYFTLGSPAGLERISSDIFKREQDKAAALWGDALAESRAILRTEMLSLVTHMVERLEPGPDGKRKRFQASLVENLDTFLTDFAKRDIANDAVLQKFVRDAQNALKGITAGKLRESVSIRTDVRAKFDELKQRLERSVVVGARQYEID